MEILTETTDGLTIVKPVGDFDLESSPEAREYFQEILAEKRGLHVNCSEITAIDSSAIATLIEAFQSAERQKLDFKLTSVGANVMRVLQLARLDNVFPIVT